MSGTSRLFLYAENFPADDGVASTGLDRALVPILMSLAEKSTCVMLAPRQLSNLRQRLHSVATHNAILPPKLSSAIDIIVRRITNNAPRLSVHALYTSAKRLSPNASNDALLAILGSDFGSYLRAASLARRLRLPLYIYSVDEPDAPPTKVGELLSKAKGIFVITPQLGERFERSYQVKCSSMPLPYVSVVVEPLPERDQLIFVGNVNHLYGSALLDVIEAVEEVRSTTGRDVRLRMTTPTEAVKSVLGETPDFVMTGRIDDRVALLQEVSRSKGSICPIAFDDPSQMVATSFPSKLLDYLSQSKQIIVYGPENSTAVQYFRDAFLPAVATTRLALREEISKLFSESSDNSATYAAVLAKNHGILQFREKLVGIISGA